MRNIVKQWNERLGLREILRPWNEFRTVRKARWFVLTRDGIYFNEGGRWLIFVWSRCMFYLCFFITAKYSWRIYRVEKRKWIFGAGSYA